MNKKEILKSSLRILTRNKMRTCFMVLGIIIGVTALSITFTIGKGFQKQIMERVKKYLSSSDLLITATKMKMDGKPIDNLVSTLTIDDLKAIASEVPSVSMYAPVQFLPNSEIIAGNKNISTIIKGSSSNGQIVWNRGVIKGEYFDDGEELTVIVEESDIDQRDIINIERDFKIIKFDTLLPFNLIGFIAEISQALAKENISIFVVSAFSTDLILIKKKDLAKTIKTLNKLGVKV